MGVRVPTDTRSRVVRGCYGGHIYSLYILCVQVEGRTPAGRWGDPVDMAGPAVFLASDAAAYVNGAVLTADGGMTATFTYDHKSRS